MFNSLIELFSGTEHRNVMARRYGYFGLGVLVGLAIMANFWREIRVVAEMRGYSMEQVRLAINATLGVAIGLLGKLVIGGSREKDRRVKAGGKS